MVKSLCGFLEILAVVLVITDLVSMIASGPVISPPFHHRNKDTSAEVEDTNTSSGRIERSTNLSQITGTARKIRMYIRNRYLQILPDGTVNGTTDENSDYTILQRSSVTTGQVKVQGVATCMFLCMDSCGLLFGSKEFSEDCVFNEMIEQHHYNTYSSTKHSNEKKMLYVSMNKKGMPRKVQIKTGTPLGKLSSFTKVLPQPVDPQSVEQLTNRIISLYPPPHHHLRHHQVCPPAHYTRTLTESVKCMKRKRRKRRKKCEETGDDEDCGRPEEVPKKHVGKKKCGEDDEDKCQQQKKLNNINRKRKSRNEAEKKKLHKVATEKRSSVPIPSPTVQDSEDIEDTFSTLAPDDGDDEFLDNDK